MVIVSKYVYTLLLRLLRSIFQRNNYTDFRLHTYVQCNHNCMKFLSLNIGNELFRYTVKICTHVLIKKRLHSLLNSV